MKKAKHLILLAALAFHTKAALFDASSIFYAPENRFCKGLRKN
jgi:hypothetical protein